MSVSLRRILPRPILSLSLLALWLLLQNSLAPGHIVLGGLLALALPPLAAPFLPHAPQLRRPLAALRLLLVVLADIVIANLTVARLILVSKTTRLRPAFFEVPLALTDPIAVSVLAGIVSLTPGTVSARFTEDRRSLLVHGLDVADAQALIRRIKTRYEVPLLGIFATEHD